MCMSEQQSHHPNATFVHSWEGSSTRSLIEMSATLQQRQQQQPHLAYTIPPPQPLFGVSPVLGYPPDFGSFGSMLPYDGKLQPHFTPPGIVHTQQVLWPETQQRLYQNLLSQIHPLAPTTSYANRSAESHSEATQTHWMLPEPSSAPNTVTPTVLFALGGAETTARRKRHCASLSKIDHPSVSTHLFSWHQWNMSLSLPELLHSTPHQSASTPVQSSLHMANNSSSPEACQGMISILDMTPIHYSSDVSPM